MWVVAGGQTVQLSPNVPGIKLKVKRSAREEGGSERLGADIWESFDHFQPSRTRIIVDGRQGLAVSYRIRRHQYQGPISGRVQDDIYIRA